MAGYDNQYTMAGTTAWKNRLKLAMVHAAIDIVGGAEPQNKQDLGKAILNNPDAYLDRFALAVATQLSTEADADPTGAGVTDGDLDTAVAAIFGDFAA